MVVIREHLRDWFAAYFFGLAFALCWFAQWYAEVILDANSETASPKLQWFAHTVENWQSEFLQLLAAAILVEAFGYKFFRKAKG